MGSRVSRPAASSPSAALEPAAVLTCASQDVTHTDDEQDPRGGRGPRQRILPQPPVSFPFGQDLQDREEEAQPGAADRQSPEQHRLESHHKVGRRVPVGAAEGLQPRGGHGGREGGRETRAHPGEVDHGVSGARRERKKGEEMSPEPISLRNHGVESSCASI